MKIAIINSPWLAIPPYGYGGREKVVYDIVEGMVKKGHQVTLFATGDCKVSSQLEFYYPKALGNDLNIKYNPYHLLNHLHYSLKKINKEFDLVHFHLAGLALYFASFLQIPFVFTLHGSYFADQEPDQFGLIESGRDSLIHFSSYPYISISNKQRLGAPELNYIKTIYNSVVLTDLEFNPLGSDRMVWLGRIIKTKGVDLAIETAKITKKILQIACYIDSTEKKYFETVIRPKVNPLYIKLSDEIKESSIKSSFLGNSKLFLMPIRWNEPFGIVMIESMACGTPIVAFAKGSVPEVVKDGETGFIVNFSDKEKEGNWIIKKTGVEGLVEAVNRIYSMPPDQYQKMRANCRKQVEQNFTVQHMVDEYEKAYQQILNPLL